MRRGWLWLPLGACAILLALVAYGLGRPRQAHLPAGPALPDFTSPAALPDRAGVSTAGFRRGHPRVLNVFASWCVPCAAEAPQLLALRRRGVAIDAIAVRDTPAGIVRFLDSYGDPFAGIGNDPDSRAQLLIGAAGVPETLVIDGRGIVRHRHVGNLTDADVGTILHVLDTAR